MTTYLAYSDLHVFGQTFLQLGEQPIAKALEEGRSSRQYNVLVQHFPEVQIRLLNGIGEHFVDAFALFAQQIRSEQHLGRPEARATNLTRNNHSFIIALFHNIDQTYVI